MKKILFGGLLALLAFATPAQAQYLRNSYFMEGASTRMQLNPAFQPTRGYVNLPVIGSLNAEVSSNALGVNDIINVFDSDGEFYNENAFYNKLKANNELNVNLNTDVVSFGFHRGKGFWSFNLGLRVDVDASIPRTMFDYLRSDPNELNSFDITRERLKLNAYTEIGVGYSRTINSRLTVGAKVKALLGAANLNLNVNQIKIDGKEDGMNSYLDVKSDAEIEVSANGLELEEEDGYISDLKYNNFGIGGYGAGIDLGASYRLTDCINVSAAVLDLGFISWSKKNTSIARSDMNQHTDATNYQGNNGDVLDFDLFQLKKVESKARTTSLSPTIVLGGDYNILNNKLGFGLLSTTRIGQLKTYSELTVSATARPNSLINATVSYSMLQGSDTFGFAIKLGPVMLGTDYMFLGNNAKHVNAFIGMSIPLGKKKQEN